jgi:uncharacterized protein (UPF0276 family)
MTQQMFPSLGLGLGLRSQHFKYILEHNPDVAWFEIISENFMDSGGRPRYMLDQIRERYPIVCHGVSLSIGSTDPLNYDYLHKLKHFSDAVQPQWVSDHLCWTGVNGINTHDLLPVALTEETLIHISKRVQVVQDILGRPLVLENPSTYAQFIHSTIPEWEFLNALVVNTGCKLLLDINNVYVSSHNNNYNPYQYIDAINHDAVVQLHIAGHQQHDNLLIDTHDCKPRIEVLQLLAHIYPALQSFSLLLEWDDNIPEFPLYLSTLKQAYEYCINSKTPVSISDTYSSQQGVSTPIDFLVNTADLEVNEL